MKRFYKEVGVDHAPEGFRILLDGKPIKTPGRRTLLLPTQALALAIAEEWRGQGEEIVPISMPMLRMANTTLDGVSQTRDAVIAAIMRFGEHELLCYRAQSPAELALLQAAEWAPMLEWVHARYGVRLLISTGVVHVQQPPETLARLGEVVAAYDDFALAALHVMASITASLVLARAWLKMPSMRRRLFNCRGLTRLIRPGFGAKTPRPQRGPGRWPGRWMWLRLFWLLVGLDGSAGS